VVRPRGLTEAKKAKEETMQKNILDDIWSFIEDIFNWIGDLLDNIFGWLW